MISFEAMVKYAQEIKLVYLFWFSSKKYLSLLCYIVVNVPLTSFFNDRCRHETISKYFGDAPPEVCCIHTQIIFLIVEIN